MNRRDFLKVTAGAGLGIASTLIWQRMSAPSGSRKRENYSGATYPNHIYINGNLIVDDQQESISALERVFEDKQSVGLSNKESEKNIVDNLVIVAGFDGISKRLEKGKFEMKSKGVGTGFRLTTDGFILTAYHNIREYENDWRKINEENPPTEVNIHSWMENMQLRYAIVDQRKNVYPIDTTFWATNPSLDIALIKAVIRENPKPIGFRVVETDLEVGDEIKLMGLSDQRPYNQYGKVISVRRDGIYDHPETGEPVSRIYDTFLTDAYGIRGFSGGIFITLDGELAGLALYINKNGNGEIGPVGGAKVRHLVTLVKECTHKLSGYETNPIKK